MLKYKGMPVLASEAAVRKAAGVTVEIGPPQIVAARDDSPDEGTFVGPHFSRLGKSVYLNWSFWWDAENPFLPDRPNGRVSHDGGLTWEKQQVLMPAGTKYQTGEREITAWFRNGFELPGQPGDYKVPTWRSSDLGRTWGEHTWTTMAYPGTKGLDTYDPPEEYRKKDGNYLRGGVKAEPPACLAPFYREVSRLRGPGGFHSMARDGEGGLYGMVYARYLKDTAGIVDWDREYWQRLNWYRYAALMQVSRDNGRTWTFGGVAADGSDYEPRVDIKPGSSQYSEDSFVINPDGQVAPGYKGRVVRLDWQAGAGVETYEVWRATTGTPELIGISGTTNYLDRAVQVGVEYFYRLRGVNLIGTSDWSDGVWGWCRAARDDFTGDGLSDLWYYHAPNGTWYVIVGEGEAARAQLGWAAAMPAPADYDGDGLADPMVFHAPDGYWAALLSGSGYQKVEVFGWGGPGSVPVPGDYDGDGLTDPAVYHEDQGLWRVWLSGSGYAETAAYGLGGPGRQAVPGDFDGDGLADPCVYSAADGKWHIWESGSNYALREISDWSLGGRAVIPVAGDYLGIGHDVPGLYYRESGLWYFRRADGTTRMEELGGVDATPLVGDYDGDGVTDMGLIQRERFETIWRLLMSEAGYREVSGHIGRPTP